MCDTDRRDHQRDSDVPAALELAVRMPSPQNHAHDADRIRQRRHEVRLDVAETEGLDDRGRKKLSP